MSRHDDDPVPWPWQEDGREPPASAVVRWWLAHPKFQPGALDADVADSLIDEYIKSQQGLRPLDAVMAERVLNDLLLSGPGLEGLDLSGEASAVAWAYHLRRVAQFSEAEQNLRDYMDAVREGAADDTDAIARRIARAGVDPQTANWATTEQAAEQWREDTLHDAHIDLLKLRADYPDVAGWEVTAHRAAGSSSGGWAGADSALLRECRIPPAVDLARRLARLQAYVSRYQQYLPASAPGTSLDGPLHRISKATAAMAQAASEALAVLGEQPGRPPRPPAGPGEATARADLTTTSESAGRRQGPIADRAFSGLPALEPPASRQGRLRRAAAAALQRRYRRVTRTGRAR